MPETKAAPTPAGEERVIKVAIAAYVDPTRRAVSGKMGETVRVHPDFVERFDELNRPPSLKGLVDNTPNIVDVRKPTAVEQRVMEGFGNQPITVEAQQRIMAGEGQD